jgi:hypothetical protein
MDERIDVKKLSNIVSRMSEIAERMIFRLERFTPEEVNIAMSYAMVMMDLAYIASEVADRLGKCELPSDISEALSVFYKAYDIVSNLYWKTSDQWEKT